MHFLSHTYYMFTSITLFLLPLNTILSSDTFKSVVDLFAGAYKNSSIEYIAIPMANQFFLG